MDKIYINGGKPLHGEVTVSGAKNAAVAILPAVILAQDVCRVENIPNISDVTMMIRILHQLGAKITKVDENTYDIDSSTINSYVVSHDLNEFLTQCRIGGYFNIDDLQTVVQEPNGQLSFLPKAALRPMNPNDMGMNPQKETSPVVVISDGEILFKNLKACGKNEIWLRKELKEGNYPPIGKIYTAFVNNDELSVYEMNEEGNDNDIYS